MDAAERKRLLSAYLQGTLPEEERRRVEAEYAADDDLFEELIELENDRIDSQARRAPSSPEGIRLVKGSVVTAGQRERSGFARALLARYPAPVQEAEPTVPAPASAGSSLAARPTAPRRRLPLGLAAAILVIAAALGALFATNGQLRREVQTLRDEQVGLRRSGQDVARELERLGQELRTQPPASEGRAAESPRAPVRIASLRLLGGGGRSAGDPQTLRLVPGTDLAQLELDLERDEYPRYRAVLETVEGKAVWSQADLASRRAAGGESLLVLRLPPGVLPAGDYVLRLIGVPASGASEPVEAYSFTVARGVRSRP